MLPWVWATDTTKAVLASPASGCYHIPLADHETFTGYVTVTGHVTGTDYVA